MSHNKDPRSRVGLTVTGKESTTFKTVESKAGLGPRNQLVQEMRLQQKIELNFPPGQSMPVLLPRNYYRPMGADSLDLRNLIDVPNGTVNSAEFRFKAPKSSNVRFTHYAVYTDILLAANVEFIPRIERSRILQYHGDPNNDFKINLSIAPDLSDNALIPCEVVLQAGQEITWSFTNQSGAIAPMGVRMVGYVDTYTPTSSQSFGG